MADPLGIGIIGTGTIAQAHLRALQETPQARAVAVFDVLRDRAETTARAFGVEQVAASLEELLARREIDAVIVCTPPFAHAEPTIMALEAGKHVLCEKPFALDPADAERMVASAERVGKFLACASGRGRYSQAQRTAQAMIERGELGEVYHVRSTSLRFRGRPGHHIFAQSSWFLDSERAGGGVIMDGSVYTIDSVLWLLGNPPVRSVVAQMRQFTEEPPPPGVKQDVEDHAVIMLQCEGGKSAIVESAWVSNMDEANGLFVFGSKAGLRFEPLRKIWPERLDPAEVERPTHAGDEVYRLVQERVLPFERAGATEGMGYITGQFVAALAEGRPPMTPGRDALEVTRVIDAAYRSVRERTVVGLA